MCWKHGDVIEWVAFLGFPFCLSPFPVPFVFLPTLYSSLPPSLLLTSLNAHRQMNEWIMETEYIWTPEYYPAIKKEETKKFRWIWKV